MMRAVADARISVRVEPRARRDELVGLREGVLVVRDKLVRVEGVEPAALRAALES